MNIVELTDAQFIAIITGYDGPNRYHLQFDAIKRIQAMLNITGQLSKTITNLGFKVEFAYGMMDGWDSKARLDMSVSYKIFVEWHGFKNDDPDLNNNRDYIKGYHLSQEAYARIFTDSRN